MQRTGWKSERTPWSLSHPKWTSFRYPSSTNSMSHQPAPAMLSVASSLLRIRGTLVLVWLMGLLNPRWRYHPPPLPPHHSDLSFNVLCSVPVVLCCSSCWNVVFKLRRYIYRYSQMKQLIILSWCLTTFGTRLRLVFKNGVEEFVRISDTLLVTGLESFLLGVSTTR